VLCIKRFRYSYRPHRCHAQALNADIMSVLGLSVCRAVKAAIQVPSRRVSAAGTAASISLGSCADSAGSRETSL
jgi:hypothetical protein